MVTTRKLVTAEELLALGDDQRFELIDGELVPMPPPPGYDHSRAQANIVRVLGNYAHATQEGAVRPELGFALTRHPDTVVAPDVAFLKAKRATEQTQGYVDGPPDLAVEIVSPSNTPAEVRMKVRMYLDAGSQMVWVVDPSKRMVTVYERGGEPKDVPESEELTGGEILPAFSCRVSEFFEEF